MKTLINPLVIALFLCLNLTLAWAGEKASQQIIDLANVQLVEIGTDPIIIKAVKTENGKGKTLDQIKKTDEEWKATAGYTDYMKAMIDSECGVHLREMQKETPYFSEIFVMDNQGANVAMTDKTSDYWQGDEAKFIESYKDGKGGIHISDVEFDESAQKYLVQVSVPVKDNGTVIGAVTIGIDVDKFKASR